MKLWHQLAICICVMQIHSDTIRHLGIQRERVELPVQVTSGDNRYMTRVVEITRTPDAQATVVLCHGFMCSKDDIKFLRWIFPKCNTVVFDFRGHGEQHENQCCTFGHDEAHEVASVAQYVRQSDIGHLPLIAYGFSMGAAASIRAQALHPELFDCAIWDCPYDSTDTMLQRCIEKLRFSAFGYSIPLPGRNILKRHVHRPWVQSCLKAALKTVAQIDTSPVETNIKYMAPRDLIQQVKIPALFIGCWNDERTPYEAVKQVYDNAAGDKQLWMTPGRRHFDSFFYDPDAYASRVQQFVEEYVQSKYERKT